MFTGIIESISTVVSLKNEESNLNISCKSEITNELKINKVM